MIVIKIANRNIVQVALAPPTAALLSEALQANRSQKLLTQFARNLTQSNARNQRITSVNNQQLIPIARNISFRKTHKPNCHVVGASRKFSLIGETSPIVSAELDYPKFDDNNRETSIESIKRHTKTAAERREQSSNNRYYGQIFNETLTSSQERRLVVLLTWLTAKEKHIEKYRQFYLDRGFDVLNVKTLPLDLLLPGRGTQKISRDFVRFMKDKNYSDVVIHGFSVGGYMFGELLCQIDQQDPKSRDRMLQSIKGLVFDSLVPIEGVCYGVANSISNNRFVAMLIEKMLETYLVVGKSFATKYYERVSKKVWAGPLKCPALFFMSKDDKISDHKIVTKLSDVWGGLGIETHNVLFDHAPHVQMFTKHHQAYVSAIDGFLKKIKLDPIN